MALLRYIDMAILCLKSFACSLFERTFLVLLQTQLFTCIAYAFLTPHPLPTPCAVFKLRPIEAATCQDNK